MANTHVVIYTHRGDEFSIDQSSFSFNYCL